MHRPADNAAMPDREETLGQAALEALRRLVRARLARKAGGHLIESSLGEIELLLRISLDDAGAAGEFSKGVVREIDGILDDEIEHAAAFRPGYAWCGRCGTADCEHSVPASNRHVFVGYGPTGTPRWEDFAQLCLERQHPQVDRLYDPAPALLTLVHEPAELERNVLAPFRNGAYELLGQVTAGFFGVPTRVEEGRGVLAVTAQIAASRSRRGEPRLGLNLLGRTPSGEPLDLLWERQDDLPWRAAVRWAQLALHGVGAGRSWGRRGVQRAEIERRVAGILRGLARRIEHDHRSRGRRTRHAEERHRSGERPTSLAIGDARAAGEDALFRDERSGAIVVIGERGRTHFFTPAGRLVSSVRYSRDAIERKIQFAQWRKATCGEVDEFRTSVGLIDGIRTGSPAGPGRP